jgi:hypothetical protein
MKNLLKNRPDLDKKKIEKTRKFMELAIPYANIEKNRYESISKNLSLPDSGDNHVLAAAIVAKAHYIVTFNLKDFPASELKKYDIISISPDQFILSLVTENIEVALLALEKQKNNLKINPRTTDELLTTLSKHGIPVTASFLRLQF